MLVSTDLSRDGEATADASFGIHLIAGHFFHHRLS